MKEKATELMSVTYKEEAQPKIKETREAFIEVTTFIMENLKDSREKSLTLTKLEEACMWAIKGITREDNSDISNPKTEQAQASVQLDPQSLVQAINRQISHESIGRMSNY